MSDKNPTIAEILHYAADQKLSPDGTWLQWVNGNYVHRDDGYSCSAVSYACYALAHGNHDLADALHTKVRTGLQRMGLNTGSLIAFKEFKVGPERQAARYNWLKFAALIAEEQGV